MADRDETLLTSGDNNNEASPSSSHHNSKHLSHGRQLLYLSLALAVLLQTLPAATAAPGGRNSRSFDSASRINRRGFKSSLLSTARGFGKRSAAAQQPSVVISEPQGVIGLSRAAANTNSRRAEEFGSNDVPTYELAEEAVNNPQMLALLINLLDLNSDGYISQEEVLRLRAN